MKKTVLTFGLISGALSSLMMVATVPFAHRIGFNNALIVGYTTIVLSFLLVFFGIRSYRDNASNGQITFTKAFAVGISITLISCIHHADFRGGPEEKGAIATGTITLAGILIEPVPANVLLASPGVVVDVHVAEVFRLAKVTGHTHQFRDTFAVSLFEGGAGIETVSVLLGYQSIRVTEKHYNPWVKTRQDALDNAVESARRS